MHSMRQRETSDYENLEIGILFDKLVSSKLLNKRREVTQ
jgi:hypothetical protein